ncbi:BLUF domain-containing protein [Sphingobium sp. AN641]|uniref:BLUF domain-containing protein n=1 Tax=Sphingobium sp. AN641 TaxID=3133443 RepID=UPI0030C0A58C
MALYQIMYISTAARPISADECRGIAYASAANNRRQDVTGLLLFNSRRFLQVLEGPEPSVNAIFDRITADPRHRAVVRLRQGSVANREFGEWAMAFDDPGHSSATLSEKVALLLDKAGPSTRAHFIGSAEMHRAH